MLTLKENVIYSTFITILSLFISLYFFPSIISTFALYAALIGILFTLNGLIPKHHIRLAVIFIFLLFMLVMLSFF